jgi:hypothetical protein
MLTLTKRVYRAARSAIETLGQTPDRLDREDLARLVVPIDNAIGDLAPAPQRGFEVMEVSVTAVVARFSQIQLASPFGFWAERIQQLAVELPNAWAVVTPPPSLAGSTAGVTVVRPWAGEPISASDLLVTGGDTAAALTPALSWSATVTTQLLVGQRRLWISPGCALVIAQTGANSPVRAQLAVAVSREGA